MWLEAVPFPYNYQGMYVIACIFGMLSLWHCTRVSPLYVEQTVIVRKKPQTSPWHSRDFRSVLVILFITHVSFIAVNALIPARLVEEMGANEGYMALYGLTELFAGALVSYAAPRLISRLGVYRLMMGAMAATALGIALLGVSNSLALGLVAAAVSGGGWMLVAMIGIISLYTETVPVEDAAHYSSAFHQVAGVVTFIAPFIGTALVQTRLDLDEIMIVGAGLRLLAAITLVAIWYSHAYPARTALLRRRASSALQRLIHHHQPSALVSPSAQAGGSAAPTPRSPKE